MKNLRKNNNVSVIAWNDKYRLYYYRLVNSKNSINITFSEESSKNECLGFDDNCLFSQFYKSNIKNNALPLIFVGYFPSAINVILQLNIKDKLTNSQIDNLISFELQKHVPVDVELLKIIYYNLSKNTEDEKIVVHVFCCLKTEWIKFEKYCLENKLKFDYIFMIDNNLMPLSIDVQVVDMFKHIFLKIDSDNLLEAIITPLKIYRHTIAKKICLILLTLVLIINGYIFISDWNRKQLKYANNNKIVNKLTKQLKNIEKNNKINKDYFRKVNKLTNLHKGMNRIDLVIKNLIDRLPKNCVISNFELKNNALTINIISSREQNKLLERLESNKFLKAINNTDSIHPNGIKEFKLNFEVNEAVFTQGVK